MVVVVAVVGKSSSSIVGMEEGPGDPMGGPSGGPGGLGGLGGAAGMAAAGMEGSVKQGERAGITL